MGNQELVQQYVQGWKDGNEDLITSILSPACVIVESHGPTYRGIEEVREWIRDWYKPGSSVDTWEITLVKDSGDYIFFEWFFSCTVDGQKHSFLGASIAKIEESVISELREYRMTEQPFDWKK